MKNFISLFVLLFVFVIKSNAQEVNDYRFVKQESAKLTIAVSSSSNNSETDNINLTKEFRSINFLNKETEAQQVVTKNTDVLQTAPIVVRIPVKGVPAALTNQPLKKHDEDLIPVKVK